MCVCNSLAAVCLLPDNKPGVSHLCCLSVCCSEHGTIVHTGDWKIDENPVDGQAFDRTTFDLLSESNTADCSCAHMGGLCAVELPDSGGQQPSDAPSSLPCVPSSRRVHATVNSLCRQQQPLQSSHSTVWSDRHLMFYCLPNQARSPSLS
jgi:hypothetical protein